MDRDTYVAHVERTRKKKNRGVLAAFRVSVRRCFRVSCVQVSSAANGGRSIRAEVVVAQTRVRLPQRRRMMSPFFQGRRGMIMMQEGPMRAATVVMMAMVGLPMMEERHPCLLHRSLRPYRLL